MLFVTVQHNNLEVCIEYAVNGYVFDRTDSIWDLIYKAASWFGHCYWTMHDYGNDQGLDLGLGGGGGLLGLLRGLLGTFTESVHNVVCAQFKTPSSYAFIAILICLEHSFWLTQHGCSPTKGFTETLATYLKDKRAMLDKILEDYLTLKGSDDWFTTEHHPSHNECVEFRNIVLDNLLSHPTPSI